MSLNILKRVYSEAEIENKIGVNGEWKIEVVCPNGSVKKPLGDKWRKNLIQDRGLNIFNGTYGSFGINPISFLSDEAGSIGGYTPGSSGTVSKGLIHSAYFGDSSDAPFSTNNTFLRTLVDDNIFWTKRLTANIAENTSPMSSDIGSGTRTMTRVWDFRALQPGQIKMVREIGISAGTTCGIGSADQAIGSEGTFNTNVPLISRFVLPEAVELKEYEFLRLYYTIKITIPAISEAGTVPINLSNNGFDAWGRLRLIGPWSSIFDGGGTIFQDASSSLTQYTSTTRPQVPWSIIGKGGVSDAGAGGLGAAFLRGNTDPTQNFAFPNPNTDFSIPYSGAFPSTYTPWYDTEPYVSTSTAGGTLSPVGTSEIAPVNGVVSREASILFPANNPSSDGPIAGMFIFPQSTLNQASVLAPRLTLGYPLYGTAANWGSWTAIGRMAWYWQFTDQTFTSRRSVYKDRNYGLAVSFRQSVARG